MAQPATIVPRFGGDGYGPGDTVEGVLEALEPVERLRSINAYLRYVDHSPDFAGAVTHDAVESLHEGPLEQGQKIPFELRLPDDALPNWDHPSTEGMGTLSWSLVLETDVAQGLDKTITHAVPVNPDAAGWSGPELPAEPRTKSSGKWDVEIALDPFALRRGEAFTLDVAIGDPDGSRDTLEIDLFCQVGYDVEVTVNRSGGDTDYVRQTNWVDLVKEPAEIDPAAPSQRLEFRVPEDAPFSYGGKALGMVWMVVAREQRRLRSDPRRIAYLEVRP
jgi:hypothetical protein